MPTQVPSRIALTLDGSRDHVTCGPGPTSITAEFTVEAWIRPDGDQEGTIVGHGGGATASGWSLAASSTRLIVVVSDGTQRLSQTFPCSFGDGWHHVAVTLGSGRIAAYVDGSRVGRVEWACTVAPPIGRALEIGRDVADRTYFRGAIAEVRLWDTSRGPFDLAPFVHFRVTGARPGLVGCWPLDGRVRDISGAARHGLNQGGTWTTDPTLQLFAPSEELAASGYTDADGARTAVPRTELGSFTVQAWVKTAAGDSGGILNWGGTTSPNSLTVAAAAGDLVVTLADGFLTGPLRMKGALLPSPRNGPPRWRHVAVTRQQWSGKVTVLVDGVVSTTADRTTGTLVFDGPVELRPGSLQLADVRIWRDARQPEEIAAGRGTRLPVIVEDVFAYWRLASPGVLLMLVEGGHLGMTTALGKGLRAVPAPDLPLAPFVYPRVLAFESAIDTVMCGPSPAIAPDGLTVEAWVGPVTSEGVAISQARSMDGKFGWAVKLTATSFTVHIEDGTTGEDIRIGGITRATVWCHMAFTLVGSTFTLYLDGSPFYTSTLSFAVPLALGDLVLGRNPAFGDAFGGRLADVRVWTVARTAEEIATGRTTRLTGTEPGLAAYLPLLAEENPIATTEVVRSHPAPITGTEWRLDHDLTIAPTTGTFPARATLGSAARAPAAAVVVAGAPAPPPMAPAMAVRNGGTPPPAESLDEPLRTLLTELYAAKGTGTTVTLTSSTFSGFDLFSGLDGLLLSSLTVQDAVITVVPSAQVEVTADGRGRRRFAAAGDAGVKVTGTATVLGLASAELTIEFVVRSDRTKATLVTVRAAGSATLDAALGSPPDAVATLLTPLRTASLARPTIAFASDAFDDAVEPHGLGVAKGLNLFASLDADKLNTGDPVSAILGLLARAFGTAGLVVRLALDRTATGTSAQLDLVITRDATLLHGDGIAIVGKGAAVTLTLPTPPATPTLSLSTELALTLSFLGADQLRLVGSVTGAATGLSAAFSMDTSLGRPWHPFGYDGLSIGTLALATGVTYVEPYVKELGLAATDATIGSGDAAVSADLAVRVDTTAPDKFALAIATPGMTLLQLLACFSPSVMAAYQVLPSSVRSTLDRIVGVRLTGAADDEKLRISIAPADTTIGTVEFEEGVHAHGALTLWGWRAAVAIDLEPQSVELDAQLDPIVIAVAGVDVLAVRGAGADQRPALRLRLGTAGTPLFAMGLSVTVLGISTSIFAALDDDGLRFSVDRRIGPAHVTLEVLTSSSRLTANGTFTFALDVALQIPGLGELRLVDVNLAASARLMVVPSSSFELILSGTVSMYGSSFSVALTLNTPIADVPALVEALVAYLAANVQSIFGAVWATFEEWGRATLDGVIAFSGSVAAVAKQFYGLTTQQIGRIIEVSRLVGDGLVRIAEGVQATYQMGADAFASAAKAAGYSAVVVLDALTTGYTLTTAAAAKALGECGYAIGEIANGLLELGTATVDQLVMVLRLAREFPAAEIAAALVSAFGASATTVVTALQKAGYAAAIVADTLKTTFDCTAAVATSLLQLAGYGAEDVGKAMRAAFQLDALAAATIFNAANKGARYVTQQMAAAYKSTAQAIAVVLKQLSYAVDQIGDALKAVYSDLKLAGNAVFVLKSVGYTVEQFGAWVQEAYALTADAAAFMYRYQGYAVEQVATVLKSFSKASAQTAAAALKSARFVAREAMTALKSVYQQTAQLAAAAMKYADYLTGEVAQNLKDVYGLTAREAAEAMKAAGYTAEEIFGALQVTFSIPTDALTELLKGVSGFFTDTVPGWFTGPGRTAPLPRTTVIGGSGPDMHAQVAATAKYYNGIAARPVAGPRV